MSNLNPEHANMDLEQFKEHVRAWVALDEQIKKLKIAAKERKKQLNVLSQSIKTYMEAHNIDDLNTQNGKIRFTKKEVKKPVTVSEMKDALEKMPNATSGEVLENLLSDEKRPVVYRESLKRTAPRTSMILSI